MAQVCRQEHPSASQPSLITLACSSWPDPRVLSLTPKSPPHQQSGGGLAFVACPAPLGDPSPFSDPSLEELGCCQAGEGNNGSSGAG